MYIPEEIKRIALEDAKDLSDKFVWHAQDYYLNNDFECKLSSILYAFAFAVRCIIKNTIHEDDTNESLDIFIKILKDGTTF